jgi:uncharacterized protein (UPF0335 family)
MHITHFILTTKTYNRAEIITHIWQIRKLRHKKDQEDDSQMDLHLDKMANCT